MQRIFGYDTASLLGQPLTHLFPKENPVRLKDTQADGQQYVVGMHDDGRAMHLKFATVHILWDGMTARVIKVKPVDEPKQDERYDVKTDNGVDMIVCFDSAGKITFANSTFGRAYNRSRQELLGANMQDILPGREYDILKINMDSLTPENPSLRVQVQHECDGMPVAIHDWIWHAVLNGDGAIIEYQRTGRDISEVVANIVTAGYF